MAEFIMKEKLRKIGLEDQFIITSKATSYEEQGNSMHLGARKKLEEKKIPYTDHQATRLESNDYEKYDYFVCMDTSNIENAKRILGKDLKKKIVRLLDLTPLKRDISDPWYTNDFEQTYQDLEIGLESLITYLKKTTSNLN